MECTEGDKYPTYPIEQNQTKNQLNPIELQLFDWVRQSNKITHFAVSSIFKPIKPI